MSLDWDLITTVLFVGVWLVGIPFMIRYWRQQEDITVYTLFICCCMGWCGSIILLFEVCDWLDKKTKVAWSFKFPNPVVIKKKIKVVK